jgi:hypothetical protein
MGKVSQNMNNGEDARLTPATRPANGLRLLSLQKKIIKTPAKKQVSRDNAVINRHGLSVNWAITHDGKYAGLNPDI